MNRFYVDIEDGDWYVFDSSQEPHKAVSSWSCEQDAKDDAARRNEDCEIVFEGMIYEKVTGIDLLRRANNLFKNGSDAFADRFDIELALRFRSKTDVHLEIDSFTWLDIVLSGIS